MSGRGKGGKVKGKAKSRANQVVLGPDLQNILGQSYDYLSFYDNAKVTINLRRMSNLQDILQ